MNLENGETFWKATKEEACSGKKHVVLYGELATVIRRKASEDQQRETYFVEQGGQIFALRVTNPTVRAHSLSSVQNTQS